MKNKRRLLRVYKFFGLRPCKKREKFSDKPNIYQHRRVKETIYPENWKAKLSRVCVDGTIVTYNPVENQIATDEALAKLKLDTIKGQTLEHEE